MSLFTFFRITLIVFTALIMNGCASGKQVTTDEVFKEMQKDYKDINIRREFAI